MHGAKGPGGRGVFLRRRLLAILVVLLLLALLAPRACQALLGSNEDTGQGEGQRSGVGGKAAGSEDGAGASNAGTGNAEKSGTQDDSAGRGAPFVKEGPGGEEGKQEASEEAAPDLGAMVTNLAVIDGSEDFAASEDQGSTESAPDESTPDSSETGGEQPMSELQFALAASPAPQQQPATEPEPAPIRRSKPEAAAPAAESTPAPLGERIRDRANRRVTAALAEPAALDEVAAPQAAAEPVAPVAAEPVAVVPAPVEPVAAAPAAPEPAFVPTPANRALGGAPPVPAARATVPVGPRVGRLGPARISRPAVL